MDDRIPARRDVLGRQRRAVVEFDALADLEGVGLPVIGRLRHRRAQIAHKVGGRGRVFRVDPDQHAVERRGRMNRRVSASRDVRQSSAAHRPGSCSPRCRRASARHRPAPAAASAIDAQRPKRHHRFVTPAKAGIHFRHGSRPSPGCRRVAVLTHFLLRYLSSQTVPRSWLT